MDYKIKKSKNYWADIDFSGKLFVKAASSEALFFYMTQTVNRLEGWISRGDDWSHGGTSWVVLEACSVDYLLSPF